MRSSDSDLAGRVVIVAGGTGNVGTHIVRALLQHGSTVAVPSRSQEKIEELRQYLSRDLNERELSRLAPFIADVTADGEGEALAREIVARFGPPAGVVASLGRFLHAPSLLEATAAELRQALDSYTVAHFMMARSFLPRLAAEGGSYLFINGPLAFQPWKDAGAHLVSIATAGQHMLFRALAQQLEGSSARVSELVIYSFVRERKTQPGSALAAESVGEFAAHLLRPGSLVRHGQTIHLKSPGLLEQAGIVAVPHTDDMQK